MKLILKKNWVLEFCDALVKNNIDLQWSLPTGTRSEALDLEVLQSLAKAKLTYLVYAPESGHEETLKRIKKRLIEEGYMVEECSICGWNEERITDGLICLGLDFLDGDSTHTTLDNMRLLSENYIDNLSNVIEEKSIWQRYGF